MKQRKLHLLLAAGLLAAGSAFGQAITIDTVFVGEVNNANDSTGFGSVSYGYHIGTTPVTNAQYTSFLNAVATSDPHGLWNSNMGSSVHGGISRSGSDGSYTYGVRTADSGFNNGQSMANMPVNFVSFWDAARFTNWLTSGNTETGVYNLGNVTNPDNATITRNLTYVGEGNQLWAVANGNEWYKAAYFDPTLDSGNGGYWLYPTQNDTAPTATTPNSTNANSANFDGAVVTVTPLGSYELAGSYYGTFDQGGNVWERLDDASIESNFDLGVRDWRGGSFQFSFGLQSSFRVDNQNVTIEREDLGFRVSSQTAIPEPGTYAAIFGSLGLALVLTLRVRRR